MQKVELRPYQERAVKALVSVTRGIAKCPAGAGKTIIGAAALDQVIRRMEKPRILWVANTTEQCDQARDALALYPYIAQQAAEIKIGCYASQISAKGYDIAVYDECFPAGTLVGATPIQDIAVGDLVPSFNGKQIEQKRVTHVFKSSPSSLVKITTSYGHIISTPNHPYLTQNGWTPAQQLQGQHVLRGIPGLSRLWGRDCRANKTSSSALQAPREGLLLQRTLSRLHQSEKLPNNGRYQPQVRLRKNAVEKPHAFIRCSGKIEEYLKRNALETKGSGRERETSPRSPSPDGAGVRLGYGGKYKNSRNPLGVPRGLQSRFRKSRVKSSRRDRWKQSLLPVTKSAGQKENRLLEWVRVDGVEVLQPGSDGEYGGLCPGGHVYNLEVEDTHTYLADSYVVHNCHHLGSELTPATLEGHEGIRWGLSATPERADDRRDLVFELCGPIVCEVGREELLQSGHLSEAVVVVHQIGESGDLEESVAAAAEPEIRAAIKRYRFCDPSELRKRVTWKHVLDQGVVNHAARNERAAELAISHSNDHVIVLVPTVEHGERLKQMIPGSEIVHSKLGKKKRSAIIEAFKKGDLRIMIGTSLLDEGFNAPVANVLINVAAGRSARLAEQRTGRVLRSFKDKACGIIHDFDDAGHGYLRNQSRSRQKVFRELGYTIQDSDGNVLFDGLPTEEVNIDAIFSDNAVDVMPSICEIHTTDSKMKIAKPVQETPAVCDSHIKGTQKEVDHASRAHARYSPSTFAYREACPHWENDNDPEKSTAAADQGTKLHEFCERETSEGLEGDEKMFVDMCLGYAQPYKDAPGAVVMREVKLKVLDQYGTVDLLILNGTHADMMDYKMGRHGVEPAENNPQGQGYMLGVWDKFPQIESVTVHFLLPRRDEVSTHTYYRSKDYNRVKLRIATIIARAKKPQEFCPSEGVCMYCGAKSRCAALATRALSISKKLQPGLVLPEKIELDASNPQQVAMLLSLAPIMEGWTKQIRDGALRLSLEEGMDIPGFRRFTKSTPRRVTSILGAWDALKEKMTIEDFLSTCTNLSIVQLEDKFAENAKRGEKKATRQELENILRHADLLKEESEVAYLRAVVQ